MVILENGKYIVHIPERSLYQDINPNNHCLPFVSEQQAKDWEGDWLAKHEAARAEAEAAAILAKQEYDAARPKRKILTKYEFRSLFSQEEKAAIKTASKTDVMIEVFNEDTLSADEINLDFPDVFRGLTYLVAKKLIPQQKMDDILKGV